MPAGQLTLIAINGIKLVEPGDDLLRHNQHIAGFRDDPVRRKGRDGDRTEVVPRLDQLYAGKSDQGQLPGRHIAEVISLSAPGGGEGRGEVGRAPSSERRRPPHPPSAAAPGPSLSPRKRAERGKVPANLGHCHISRASISATAGPARRRV